jgi:ATP-binding cassette subfamily B protein
MKLWFYNVYKWLIKQPFVPQLDKLSCGATCLKIISQHHGKSISIGYLENLCYQSREGVSLFNIFFAAEKIGFKTFAGKFSLQTLTTDHLPCILHWNQNHFVVLLGIKKNKSRYTIADPGHGIVTIDRETFSQGWVSTTENQGVALFLEPTDKFFAIPEENKPKKGFSFLINYLYAYKKLVFQVLIGMLVTSLITLLLPVLTQVLIDKGVNKKNISIVYLVILSQFVLFLGSTTMGVVRSWLVLHINTRISLSIISDFLIKLMSLPIKYFESKTVGDLSQRISDHHRIETFITGETINSIFSVFNIIAFVSLLAYYNLKIVLIFVILSICGVMWVFLFQKKRKELDYSRFERNTENQNKLFEMITGMQEIKLYGSETSKRWEWEELQVKYFNLNIKSLLLEQYQGSGFVFFNQLKNLLISFLVSMEVINGNLTLGIFISISYIIGQSNGPLEQLVSLIKSGQDAILSMRRLQEVFDKPKEERDNIDLLTNVPHQDITISNLSFQYLGPQSPFVLKDINLVIPKGKVTAIVGTSGSGKTTLMKLLLNFYSPVEGAIKIGNSDLSLISPKYWRSLCGSVMQDGFIFYDTIAKNIALDGKEINQDGMDKAVKIANLEEYIGSLPLKFLTKIGNSGIGISGGQKQRILIARSVYKNPHFLFFDEASSSLDANNEKVIMDNLNEFFQGKTVLIIAHRLSTVKNADQIVVLDDGTIVEVGDHSSLTKMRGKYFELVKNQLELGN